MGTFVGHANPGSMFIFLSLWWSFLMAASYHDKTRKHQRFVSSVAYKCCNAPIEGIIKIVLPVVGIVCELVVADSAKLGHTAIFATSNFQHITMYSLYMLSGIVDILTHFKGPFPKNTDYAVFSLTILLEGFMIKNHSHGKDELYVLTHMILAYTVAVSGLLLLLEAKLRTSILICLGRPFCYLLKGMWFWQMGYILFPNPFVESPWENTHARQMQVGSVFVWLCIASFISVLSIFVCVGRYLEETSENEKDMTNETKTLLIGEEGY